VIAYSLEIQQVVSSFLSETAALLPSASKHRSECPERGRRMLRSQRMQLNIRVIVTILDCAHAAAMIHARHWESAADPDTENFSALKPWPAPLLRAYPSSSRSGSPRFRDTPAGHDSHAQPPESCSPLRTSPLPRTRSPKPPPPPLWQPCVPGFRDGCARSDLPRLRRLGLFCLWKAPPHPFVNGPI